MLEILDVLEVQFKYYSQLIKDDVLTGSRGNAIEFGPPAVQFGGNVPCAQNIFENLQFGQCSC